MPNEQAVSDSGKKPTTAIFNNNEFQSSQTEAQGGWPTASTSWVRMGVREFRESRIADRGQTIHKRTSKRDLFWI